MAVPRQRTTPPAERLSTLALEFRGTRDPAARAAIARAYAQAVEELVASRKWTRMPPLEDQLPDEWMPDAFFTHWALRLPPQRTKRTG